MRQWRRKHLGFFFSILGTLLLAASALAQPWTQLTPSGGPPPGRDEHSAILDPSSKTMVIFGGINSPGSSLNDTWRLTNADGQGPSTWTQVTTGNPAPALRSHSAVYDPIANNMIVYGGTVGAGTCSNATYVLTNPIGVGSLNTHCQSPPTSDTFPPATV